MVKAFVSENSVLSSEAGEKKDISRRVHRDRGEKSEFRLFYL